MAPIPIQLKKNEIQRAELDAQQYNIAREIHTTSPFASAARTLLLQKIFARGFNVYVGEKQIVMSIEEAKNFNDLWIRIAAEIFDEFFTLGMVPYRWVSNVSKHRGLFLPQIISGGLGNTYRIQSVINKREQQRYEFFVEQRNFGSGFNNSIFHSFEKRPDHTVSFLEGIGYNPQRSGKLIAPASLLIESYVHFAKLRLAVTVAEHRRAAPLIIVETDETAILGSSSERRSMPAEEATDQTLQDELAIQQYENADRRIERQANQTNAQLYKDRIDEMHQSVKQLTAPISHSSYAHQMETGIYFPLFPGQHLVRQQVPDHNSDFDKTRLAWEVDQSLAYQVPVPLVRGDTVSRSTTTSTELTIPMFEQTLAVWKNRLSDIVTALMRESIARTREYRLGDTTTNKKKKRKFSMNNKQTAAAAEAQEEEQTRSMLEWDESLLVVSLVHSDVRTPGMLEYFYATDVLSWKEFQTERLHLLPLDNVERRQWTNKLSHSKDPLSSAEKHELVKNHIAEALLSSYKAPPMQPPVVQSTMGSTPAPAKKKKATSSTTSKSKD